MLVCSHIMCKVANISETVQDCRKLGFHIEWGSAPERAHNAFIWFEEGPFIEFFQIPESWWLLGGPFGLVFGRAAGKRWYRWFGSAEGLCDLALVPVNAADAAGKEVIRDSRSFKAVKQSLNKAGLATSRIINGWRVRPDGLKVRYSFFSPEPSGLPFVVSGYDSCQRPEKVDHPNGARSIERIKMGVAHNDLQQFRLLTQGDSWLRIQPATETKLLELELAGLSECLDPTLLHGTVMTAAMEQENQYVEK